MECAIELGLDGSGYARQDTSPIKLSSRFAITVREETSAVLIAVFIKWFTDLLVDLF